MLLFLLSLLLFISCHAMEEKELELLDLTFNTSTEKLTTNDLSKLLHRDFEFTNHYTYQNDKKDFQEDKEYEYANNLPELPISGSQYVLSLSPDTRKLAILHTQSPIHPECRMPQYLFVLDFDKKTYFDTFVSHYKIIDVAISSEELCAFLVKNLSYKTYTLFIRNLKTKKEQEILTRLKKFYTDRNGNHHLIKKALAFNAASTHIALRTVYQPHKDETKIYAIDAQLKKE